MWTRVNGGDDGGFMRFEERGGVGDEDEEGNEFIRGDDEQEGGAGEADREEGAMEE